MKLKARRHDRQSLTLAVAAVLASVVCLALLIEEEPAEALLSASSVQAAGQTSFVLSEPVELLAEPRIVVRRGTIELVQPKGAAPLSSRDIAQSIDGGRGVLLLRDAEIELGGGPAEPAGADGHAIGPPMPQAPLARAVSQLNFRTLIVEDGNIRTSASRLPLWMTNVNLRMKPVPGERLSIKGSVELLGRQLDFDAAVGLSAADVTAKQVPIRGSLSSENLIQSSFSGQLAIGDGGRLIADSSYLEISDVPIFARWLGLAWPRELNIRSFRSDGRLELAGAVLNFPDGRFKLDQNHATGSLLVNGKGERPLIDGTLAFEQFDASQLVVFDADRSLLSSTVQSTADWLPPMARQLLSDLNLPILRQLDIDLRASATRTTAGSLNFGRTAAAVSIHDGRVLVDFAEMELPSGGRGSLQITIDARGPVAHCGVRGDLKAVRLEALSGLLLPRRVLSGPADVKMDLSGNWRTPDTFMRSLDGHVDLRMVNGAVLSTNLPGLVKSVALHAPPRDGWGAAISGETHLENVQATLEFKSGVARISRLLAERGGQGEVAVTGTLDLPGKHLDLNVFPQTDSQDSDSASVLSINGRWDQPKLLRRPFPNKAENPLYPEYRENRARPDGRSSSSRG